MIQAKQADVSEHRVAIKAAADGTTSSLIHLAHARQHPIFRLHINKRSTTPCHPTATATSPTSPTTFLTAAGSVHARSTERRRGHRPSSSRSFKRSSADWDSHRERLGQVQRETGTEGRVRVGILGQGQRETGTGTERDWDRDRERLGQKEGLELGYWDRDRERLGQKEGLELGYWDRDRERLDRYRERLG